LAGSASQGVVFGEELGGDPPGPGEQHRCRHGGARDVAAGHAAEQDRQLADALIVLALVLGLLLGPVVLVVLLLALLVFAVVAAVRTSAPT
jgi:hypothetical protein